MYRPQWAEEYIEVGFSQDWIDDVIIKHGSELPKQLGKQLKPTNFYKLNPLNVENNPEIITNIRIPDGYTFSEVLLLVLDCLDYFGKNIPEKDSDIYQLYQNTISKNKINFEEFYTFVRRIQYTNIPKTKTYKLVEKTVEYYTLNTTPVVNSTWEVPYKNGIIKVKVIDSNKKNELHLHDSKIYAEIIDIIKPIDIKYLEANSRINLRPYAFNNGFQI
jgi:hypothetical protein